MYVCKSLNKRNLNTTISEIPVWYNHHHSLIIMWYKIFHHIISVISVRISMTHCIIYINSEVFHKYMSLCAFMFLHIIFCVGNFNALIIPQLGKNYTNYHTCASFLRMVNCVFLAMISCPPVFFFIKTKKQKLHLGIQAFPLRSITSVWPLAGSEAARPSVSVTACGGGATASNVFFSVCALSQPLFSCF